MIRYLVLAFPYDPATQATASVLLAAGGPFRTGTAAQEAGATLPSEWSGGIENRVFEHALEAPPSVVSRIYSGGELQTRLTLEVSGLEIANGSTGGGEAAGDAGVRDALLAYEWTDAPVYVYEADDPSTFADFGTWKVKAWAADEPTANAETINVPLETQATALDRSINEAVFRGGGTALLIGTDTVTPSVAFTGGQYHFANSEYAGDAAWSFRSRGNDTLTLAVYTALLAPPNTLTTYRSVVLDSSNRYLQWTWKDSGGTHAVNSGTNSIPAAHFTDGEWHTYVCTRDISARTAFFYADGALIGTATWAAADDPVSWHFGFPTVGGQNYNFGAYSASGVSELDQFQVWLRHLSAADAESLHEAPPSGADDMFDLAVSLPLNEGIGKTLTHDHAPSRASALMGDGAGEYVAVTKTTNHQFGSASALTLEIGFCIDDKTQDNYIALNSAVHNFKYLTASSELVVMIYNSGVGWATWNTGIDVEEGRPYWATVTYGEGSGEMVLYLNGAEVYSSTASAPTLNNGGATMYFVGTTPTLGMYGWLYEIRAWDIEMAADEVSFWAERQVTGLEAGLRYAYPINEKSGSSVADLVDGGAAGTITAAKWANQFGTVRYWSAAEWILTGEGDAQVAGRYRPLAFGRVIGKEPTIEHAPRLLYRLHDRQINGVMRVMVGGTEQTNAGDSSDIFDEVITNDGHRLTGEVDVSIGSNVVAQSAGSSTAFTTELVEGEDIVINGEAHTVDTITDDTTLTTVANFASAGANVLVYRSRPMPGYYRADLGSATRPARLMLGSAPSATVHVDLQGDVDATDGYTEAGEALMRRIATWQGDLADPGDIDTAALTALQSANTAPMGVWTGPEREVPASELLTRLAAGFGGWWGLTGAGKLTAGQLVIAATEDVDIPADRLAKPPTREPALVPAESVLIEWGHREAVLPVDEASGATAEVVALTLPASSLKRSTGTTYNAPRSPVAIETACSTAAGAATAARLWADILREPGVIERHDLGRRPLVLPVPGETVDPNYDRWLAGPGLAVEVEERGEVASFAILKQRDTFYKIRELYRDGKLEDFWVADDLVAGVAASWTGRYNGLAFEQSSGTSQPVNTANKVGSRSALVFDGANDYMHCETVSFKTNNASAFYVLKVVTVTDNQRFVVIHDTSEANDWDNNTSALLMYTQSTNDRAYKNGTDGFLAASAGTTFVYGSVYAGSTHTLYRDADSNANACNSTAFEASRAIIGAGWLSGAYGSYGSMELACIGLASADLTADWAEIRDELNRNYGVY